MLGLLALALFLQVTVLNLLRIGGIIPDLLLLPVVFNAFLAGRREGAFWGLVAGLMKDVFAGGYFGLNALSMLAAGYLVGLAERRLFKESVLVAALVTWVAALFSQLIHYLLLLYLGVSVPPGTALRIVFFSALYTAALAPLFYRRFYRARVGWVKAGES